MNHLLLLLPLLTAPPVGSYAVNSPLPTVVSKESCYEAHNACEDSCGDYNPRESPFTKKNLQVNKCQVACQIAYNHCRKDTTKDSCETWGLSCLGACRSNTDASCDKSCRAGLKKCFQWTNRPVFYLVEIEDSCYEAEKECIHECYADSTLPPQGNSETDACDDTCWKAHKECVSHDKYVGSDYDIYPPCSVFENSCLRRCGGSSICEASCQKGLEACQDRHLNPVYEFIPEKIWVTIQKRLVKSHKNRP